MQTPQCRIYRVPFFFFFIFFERCLNIAYKTYIHLKWFRIWRGVKRSTLKLVGHQCYIATLRDTETERRKKGYLWPRTGWAVRQPLAHEYIRAHKLQHFTHNEVIASPRLNYRPLAVWDSCSWRRFWLTQSTPLRAWEASKVPPFCHCAARCRRGFAEGHK